MAELTKSLASTRERRSNAGANMSKLLDKEEEDEFYKTQYGGFDEAENDNDFSVSDSSDSENVIDSDFDIDEHVDAVVDEDEVEKMVQQEEKRERQAATKRKSFYREPKPTSSTIKSPTSVEHRRPVRTSLLSPTSTVRKTTLRSDDAHSLYKNLRESTKKSSRETKENLEDERQRKLKFKSKRKQPYRQPTQEERLREAKRTEIENKRSLEAYKNMEIEKSKRNKTTKKIPNVPMIRYQSYRENSKDSDPCYRTIISFPNDEIFDHYFGRYKQESLKSEIDQQPRKRSISVLSGLPIRYKDPLTGFPFAKAKEFNVIRDSYIRYLEQSTLRDDVTIKKFIESYQLSPVLELKLDQSNQQSKFVIANNSNQSQGTTTTTTNLIKGSAAITTMAKIHSTNETIRDVCKYRTLKPKLPISVNTNNTNSPVSWLVITTNNKNNNNANNNKPQVQQVSTSSSSSSITQSTSNNNNAQ
ncbi:vacuolar protein sorting-associated protein YL-1 [Dermatophagoides pteronyssinus]|uniref:vacuolar protein sorting-associated protein YL-1 n=1 Tax=Dermatophagoides pteronyssinus TaxID=6956 RepID=UPI003F676697